jgi:hypothetical protein
MQRVAVQNSPSPVVYWKSEWVETGNTIEVEKKDGEIELIPELVLVGEENPDYIPRR